MSLNLIVEIPLEGTTRSKKMILPRVSAGLTSRATVCNGDSIQFGELYQIHIDNVIHSFEPTDSEKAPTTTLEGGLIAWSAISPQDIINDLRDYGFKDMI